MGGGGGRGGRRGLRSGDGATNFAFRRRPQALAGSLPRDNGRIPGREGHARATFPGFALPAEGPLPNRTRPPARRELLESRTEGCERRRLGENIYFRGFNRRKRIIAVVVIVPLTIIIINSRATGVFHRGFPPTRGRRPRTGGAPLPARGCPFAPPLPTRPPPSPPAVPLGGRELLLLPAVGTAQGRSGQWCLRLGAGAPRGSGFSEKGRGETAPAGSGASAALL